MGRRGIVALVLVLGSAAFGVPVAQAPARAAALCQRGLESDWSAGAISLTVTRKASWHDTSGDTMTATEIDSVTSAKHPPDFQPVLSVQEACSPWMLSMSNGLNRPGVQDLSGQWNYPSVAANYPGTPSSGTCHQHRIMKSTRNEAGVEFQTSSIKHSFNTNFSASAHTVRVIPQWRAWPALTCAGQDMNFFDTLTFLNSTPVTLSVPTLLHDRKFKLKFSGTTQGTQGWHNSPDGYGGTAHFVDTWSGTVTFRPSGCHEYFFATGTASSRCYPG